MITSIKKDTNEHSSGCIDELKAAVKLLCEKAGITDEQINTEMKQN